MEYESAGVLLSNCFFSPFEQGRVEFIQNTKRFLWYSPQLNFLVLSF